MDRHNELSLNLTLMTVMSLLSSRTYLSCLLNDVTSRGVLFCSRLMFQCWTTHHTMRSMPEQIISVTSVPCIKSSSLNLELHMLPLPTCRLKTNTTGIERIVETFSIPERMLSVYRNNVGQGHRDFPFGNSRESLCAEFTAGIPGNLQEFFFIFVADYDILVLIYRWLYTWRDFQLRIHQKPFNVCPTDVSTILAGGAHSVPQA